MKADPAGSSGLELQIPSVRGLETAPSAVASTAPDDDTWFDWLLTTRHGGDAVYAAALRPMLNDIRDRVLDHASLLPGQTIADIGCGDGLVGFGALARESTSRVTFVDISPALIDHTRDVAQRQGIADRCRFIIASAEALDAIPTGSTDVVVVRAVLAYLHDKRAAIGEFRRILRPRGRISIVDPIFADRAFAVAGLASQVTAGESGVVARYIELLHRCRSAHFPDSLKKIRANPLTDYNERDLLRLFETAGFVNIHLRLHIDSIPALPMPWQTFLATSPRADTPTVGEILAARFTPGERVEFEAFMRPGLEAGTAVERNVNAYIFADNP